MSLITRCPACATMFGVVPDQLKISNGWVRCGKCADVFDASEHLVTDQPAAQQAAHVSFVHADAPAKGPAPPNLYDSVAPDFQTGELTENEVQLLDELQAFKNARTAETWNSDFSEDSVDPQQNAKLRAPSANSRAAALAPVAAQASAAATPSFLREAKRSESWRSPWVRAFLSVCVLVLVGLLGVQVALQERDRIAALEPRSLPALQELCSALDCSIAPLKQIESIVVDASSFNKLRVDSAQDFYRLHISLKNTAGVPLALPHVELSLNDAQDQSIVRRVVRPAELGATTASIAAGTEFAGGVSIQVDSAQLAGARVAGYRLLAFYP
jgi:predicted Zn finger-like uncharacterized protein